MSDPTDTSTEHSDTEISQQSIRDVLDAVRAEQLEEWEQQRLRAAQEKREKKERRIQKHQVRQKEEAKRRRAARQTFFQEASDKVAAQVTVASRALRGAVKAATENKIPRNTPEGREQNRLLRSLEEALGALRRVGHSRFTGNDVEADFDIDLV